MARPQKNNADYFSHDNDMRNDDRIRAVRTEYGHEGYSVWNMLLEKLCKAEDFTLAYNSINIKLWAGDFMIASDRLKSIIDFFIEIGLIIQIDDTIFSSKMIERFTGLLDKRKRKRDGFGQSKLPENRVSDVHNAVKSEFRPSEIHKGKESKVNKSKVKKRVFIPPTLDEFKKFFLENGYSETTAERAWKGYDVANWIDSQGNRIRNWKQKCYNVWFRPENEKEKSCAKKEKVATTIQTAMDLKTEFENEQLNQGF